MNSTIESRQALRKTIDTINEFQKDMQAFTQQWCQVKRKVLPASMVFNLILRAVEKLSKLLEDTAQRLETKLIEEEQKQQEGGANHDVHSR